MTTGADLGVRGLRRVLGVEGSLAPGRFGLGVSFGDGVPVFAFAPPVEEISAGHDELVAALAGSPHYFT
jgi:hypothetical protein